MLFAVILALAILSVVIVGPAIWSRDATRREAACRVLGMILTAFGRRPPN